jgi:hypothetical protein
MAGYTQSLVAAIVHALVNGVTPENLGAGIRSGLSASRLLHTKGFCFEGRRDEPAKLEFPVERIVEDILKSSQPAAKSIFKQVAIPDNTGRSFISIDNPRDTAVAIIAKGPKEALNGEPICTFADFITVDRQEAESLRSIRGVITEYVRNRSRAKPLSIAVFGQPGSGKSFAVEPQLPRTKVRHPYDQCKQHCSAQVHIAPCLSRIAWVGE